MAGSAVNLTMAVGVCDIELLFSYLFTSVCASTDLEESPLCILAILPVKCWVHKSFDHAHHLWFLGRISFVSYIYVCQLYIYICYLVWYEAVSELVPDSISVDLDIASRKQWHQRMRGRFM